MGDPYHELSAHTWASVRRGRPLDWNNQPDVFKHYPARYPGVALEEVPELRDFLRLCAGITARKTYPGGSWFLRVQPSAGALYPCELYLQARTVAGLEDGIYHYEPLEEHLRLLYSLPRDEGIEGWTATPLAVRGMTLLVTAIYYRSSWKYGNRAYRYCLLDGGHLVGAVEAAAAWGKYPFTVHTRLDRKRLDVALGLAPGELSLAMLRCGSRTANAVRPPTMTLPFVDGCGRSGRNNVIETHYQRTGILEGCRRSERQEDYFLLDDRLTSAIRTRRSIRAFPVRTMTPDQYLAVLQAARLPIDLDCDEPVRLLAVINRVESMEPGLYEGSNCLRKGNLADMAGYLCLEQRLGADAGVTFFFLSQGRNYLPLMLKAGIMGQRIYLAATGLGLGCSGIGAFYDQETADFLETEDMVLYAMAVG